MGIVEDVNAALIGIERPGLTFQSEARIPGLRALDCAYQAHDPTKFPYAYGGGVSVEGTQGLFEYDLKTLSGECVHLVLYTTNAGRIGFVLPRPGNRIRKEVGILTYGTVEPEMINEIAQQLAEQLKHPNKVVEGC